MHGANKTGLSGAKQCAMPDSGVAVEQYGEIYQSLARWGLKTSFLEEMLLFSNWSSGVSKLMGATFWGLMMDLPGPVTSKCCPEVIE